MSIFGLACPEILTSVVVDGLLLKLLLADGLPSKLKPPPVAGVAGDDAADAALFKFVFKALLLLALPKPKDEKFCNPGDPALPLLPNIPAAAAAAGDESLPQQHDAPKVVAPQALQMES